MTILYIVTGMKVKFSVRAIQKDGDAVSLSDERTELFKEYLTLSEKSELEELRSNYAALQNRINEYESKDKEAVLGAEIYTELKDREDFKELIKNQAIYSVEEVQTRADAILGKYVKEKALSTISRNLVLLVLLNLRKLRNHMEVYLRIELSNSSFYCLKIFKGGNKNGI